MNTKKNKSKNKPRPLPVNPNSDQLEETDVGNPDDIMKEKPEPVKSDERVPEVISEDGRPLVEGKDSEFDAPKKPKRNRGKKKKTEKSDDDDFEEKKGIEGEKDQIHESSTQLTKLPVVTTERKKKNKNKKHSESEDTKSEETGTAEASTKEKETHSTQNTLIQESSEAEIKTSKKKNKKKKRNDSEKSDKNEESITCTAAFQKILEPRDDKKNVKREDKVNEPVKLLQINSAESVVKEFKQVIPQCVMDEKILETSKEDDTSNNKHKKKQLLKEDFEGDLKPSLELKDVKHTKKKEEETKETDIQIFEAGVSIDYTKQKAKIAKPVEKKRKDKVEKSIDDATVNQIFVSEMQEKVSEFETKDIIKVVEEIPIVTKICEESNTQITSNKSTSEAIPSETESRDAAIQACKADIGKKSRKSPKSPHITSDEKFKIDPEIKSNKLESSIIVPLEANTFENLKPESTAVLKSDSKKLVSTLPFLLPERVIPQSETEDAPIKSEEQICYKTEASADRLELVQIKDDKKSRNKKKLPKIPQKIEVVEESEAKSFETTKKDESHDTKDEKSKDTTDIPTFTEAVVESDARSFELTKQHKNETKFEKPTVMTDTPNFIPLLKDVEVTSLTVLSEPSTFKNLTPEVKNALKRDLEKSEVSTSPDLFPERIVFQPETKMAPIKSEEKIGCKTETSTDKSELIQIKDDKKSGNKKKLNKIPQKIEPVEENEKRSITAPLESSTFENLTPESNAALKSNLENPVSTLPALLPERDATQRETEDTPMKSEEQICYKTEARADKLELVQIEDDKKSRNKKKLPKIPQNIEVVEETEAKSFETTKKDESHDTKDEKSKDTTDTPTFTEAVEESEAKGSEPTKIDKSHKTKDEKSKYRTDIPIFNEAVEESVGKNFEPTKKDKYYHEAKCENLKDTSGISPFTPLLEDIEITSVKAEESEGSVSDIVPDIQYPRASSLDNNNNVVIRDITADFTEKLNFPVNISDIPIISGSGETPITTPDVVTSGITVTEMKTETKKSSGEKTDLKSKVMEVNKDMEDLRLSIERSLAELTAIEKSEQQVEKSFEDNQNKMNIEKVETKKEDVTPKHNEPKMEESRVEESEASISSIKEKQKSDDITTSQPIDVPTPPICPARKENKGKGKSKKKGKQVLEQQTTISDSTATASSAVTGNTTVSSERQDTSKSYDEKSDKKTDQGKGKQQCDSVLQDDTTGEKADFEPIENFEDAMTSSADDVNKTFEIIANEDNNITGANSDKVELEAQKNPEINVTAPTEDNKKTDEADKINPVSQPKNLLGHPNIPVRLNKTDYKKEKHKIPNERQAKVNIKDSEPIDKESKESQTEFKRKYLKDKYNVDDTVNCTTSENEEFVYKYSFRKVFLPSACHVCKKEVKQARVPCSNCNLVFYCSPKHKDEDYAKHQGFCFAVSTIVHLKDQKHIYADAQNIAGHDYRLLRMQAIVSCEKVLKRKLAPCEQEILLYPRICADVSCREWRQTKLKDCDGCGQISFCAAHPAHFPKSHQRWCKSYALYQKLVVHQQTRGRLEPRLPARPRATSASGSYQIPGKMNEVLASMYDEKIDMNDIQYASLTQIATAPLTAAYCQQLYTNKMNSTYANGVHKKCTYTLHIVGAAELQFEADALNKWEVFFLHLRPDVTELRVVLIGHDLNPSNLPLDLLSKIRLCQSCRQNKRRVIFDFQDGKTYQEYWSTDFITPDLVCAFNPSIQRSSIYNGKDHWVSAIKCILKLKVPFVVTSYTMIELHRDLARIKEVSDINVNVICEPNYNSFASVRPDRNFISDDEMPLLFKNYCFMLISGVM